MMSDFISVGSHSEAGQKDGNEDSVGIEIPEDNILALKGIAAVIADGVSASEAGKEASEACVKGFLNDYYSTPDSWSVKTSGEKILTALNRWLYGQGHRLYGTPRGMVTTLSALIIKSSIAYIFHIGDTRIYHLRGNNLECLTRDHRVQVSKDKEYLSRAMGIELTIDIDYRKFSVKAGDIFFLTTDGVHDYVDPKYLIDVVNENKDDLDKASQLITKKALANSSPDNLSCQIIHIEEIPGKDDKQVYETLTALPFPPPLEPGMILDGFRVVRELHASKRTQLYLVVDEESKRQMVIKTPSVNFEDDPAYIDMFLHEEWVGKRINSPYVLKICNQERKRQFLYYVTEHVEGQTLRQWMDDHPEPALSEVRNIVDQIAKGLRAFHRMEMIHQDLKPENIIIDQHGTVKIIDFGSTKIAGIEEISAPFERIELLGTRNYTAPEYLLGYKASNRSDLFSLGTIAYEMLTGKLPYGKSLPTNPTKRPGYISACRLKTTLPPWVDGALEKAVKWDPEKRYETLSGFTYDLGTPNPKFVKDQPLPLMERNPTGFWRACTITLLIINLILIYLLTR
jgi:eukaryotic-like serine/threonine-protein kinase